MSDESETENLEVKEVDDSREGKIKSRKGLVYQSFPKAVNVVEQSNERFQQARVRPQAYKTVNKFVTKTVKRTKLHSVPHAGITFSRGSSNPKDIEGAMRKQKRSLFR